MKKHLENSWGLVKNTGNAFLKDRGLKLSASLAYYTVFALPPMLIILITILGTVFGREAIHGEVYGQLNQLIGDRPAAQVQEILANIHLDKSHTLATVFSALALIVGATGVFAEIQDSLNLIWNIEAKARNGLVKLILARLVSFSMILSIGFVLLVSLLISALLAALSAKLKAYFPEVTVVVFQVVDYVISFGVITLFFALIFKILPDAKIKFRNVIKGALATSLLFIIGKFLIALYFNKSDMANTYGAAGSIILLLVWVYYSSIILYLGAEFTKVYAKAHGDETIPRDFAISSNTCVVS